MNFAKYNQINLIYLSVDYIDDIHCKFSISEMENNYTLGINEWKVLTKKISLSKREKQCLFLYYWKGFTQEEISNCLDKKISRPAVAIYLKRAKYKISTFYNIDIDNIDRNKILRGRHAK